uniref:N-acetyltransferase domain-containing protein n=1 Tax=Leptocylindrus danicus TaxID=163516 RepID=A0A7S2PTY3_9STRA|mmetsp:Transcript_995/g.1412  ORF Transcript_995/g.1412 Transcript_995/m.1412 type:complete len:429 (+) Transcript_995:131-1417(+)
MNVQKAQPFFVATSAESAVLAIQNQQKHVLLCGNVPVRSSAAEIPVTLISPPLSMIAETLLQLREVPFSNTNNDEETNHHRDMNRRKLMILIHCATISNSYFYSPSEIEAMIMEICAIKQICSPLANQASVQLVLMIGALNKEIGRVGLCHDFLERACEAASGGVMFSLNPWAFQELVSVYANSGKDDPIFSWNEIPIQFRGNTYYPLADDEESKCVLEKVCDSSSIIPVIIQHDFLVINEKDAIDPIINACLAKSNKIFRRESFRLRRIERSGKDISSLLGLVRELAEYEKALDSVNASKEMYIRDGFGQRPYFHCFLLENAEDNGSFSACGYAVWYIGYSTWEGRFLYLEDLYIKERFRGCGAGKNIMYTLADVASSFDCGRFVWQALDWNTPARKFYKGIGAVELPDWITIRMDRSSITSFLHTR